ncbi:JmjC domain-containing protein [Streptomyces sp. NBC_01190]|uniref:JmjC domain-containing protein n=1 Tax=Streptomyces sp. NBC_01190 TaxID=2903767 RepID=UPI00386554CD|nr:cupin domain-containing protein [Streptomyces sp. NBC_01190]
MTAVGNLDRLIDTRQLARHWEDRPFVCAGLGALDGVFGLEVAERLLHSAALPAASVRLFRDGTELPARGHTRRRERGGAAREGLVDAAAVEREIAAGATLVMEELRTHHPEIADLCGEVTDETGLGTYCAAFLTPPGARGVAPHYDTASVLLRQVHGSKRWRIGSPLQRWPARDWSAAHNTPVDEIMDVVLHEGECLYLPRGFFHVGDATDEASLHLSIALRPITWGALIAAMAAEGQSEEPLRESLPYAFHRLGRQEFDRRLADRAAPLVARLTADGVPSASRGTVDRLRGAHPRTPPPRGALRAALTSRRPDRPQDRIAHEEAP